MMLTMMIMMTMDGRNDLLGNVFIFSFLFFFSFPFEGGLPHCTCLKCFTSVALSLCFSLHSRFILESTRSSVIAAAAKNNFRHSRFLAATYNKCSRDNWFETWLLVQPKMRPHIAVL